MKYSLKDHYRKLMRENQASNPDDPIFDDPKSIIKIEFPDDKPSLARFYNISDTPERTKQKPKFMATKKEVVDLGAISLINSGLNQIFASRESLTKSAIKKVGNNSKIKKIITKSFVNFVDKSTVNGILNNPSGQDFNVIHLLSNLREEDFLDFFKATIPSYNWLLSNHANNLHNFGSYFAPFETDSNGNQVPNYKPVSDLDEAFIGLINDILNQNNNQMAGKFSYTLEDFTNFGYLSDNEGNANICFRTYAGDKNKVKTVLATGRKNFVDYNTLVSREATLKDIFKNAKLVTDYYIQFRISDLDSDLEDESFNIKSFGRKNVIKAIAYEYCGNKTPATFISDAKSVKLAKNDVRKECSSIEDAINHLNLKVKSKFKDYKGKGGTQGQTKGDGEFHVHMFLDTSNACLDIEPDAIIRLTGGKETKCSVKAFPKKNATAQTGTTLPANIQTKYNKFKSLFFKSTDKEVTGKNITGHSAHTRYHINKSKLNDFVFIEKDGDGKYIISEDKRKRALEAYKDFKSSIAAEHEADGIISFFPKGNFNNNDPFSYTSVEDCKDCLTYGGMPKNKRIPFAVVPLETDYKNRLRVDKLILRLLQDDMTYSGTKSSNTLKKEIDDINADDTDTKGTLFENYRIKDNNVITEGGKAGHMMHPYENLHMKISDMKRMIEDFQNDFEISEKVDGANLFFTIDPQQGKILFSRNKSDMSHEETLEKFGPDHPAHVLFTDGANAIFNSAKNSLSKQDIQRVFGQSPEGGKTYINFEIMHPQKPNQIKYDMKYIVFHAIVDYDINGSVVESSPDDERLIHLLNQLQPSFNVANNDFSLGSNLKIKLNNLSQSDVDELLNELNSITSSLGLSDDMTIADAVKSEIRSLLDRENITELLPEDKIEMIYDFITNESTEVKGTAIKKGLDKELQKTLTSLGLTSKAKAYKIIKQIIQEFRPLFILLGIKLLHNVQSRYMSSDASNKNVDELRRLLDAAMEDYDNMMQAEDLSDVESKIFKSLTPHIANVRHHGVERVVSSPVEGGVFIGKDGNTYKVTGGFAPLNQILGTAMRSLDHMPAFKEEFVAQERGS